MVVNNQTPEKPPEQPPEQSPVQQQASQGQGPAPAAPRRFSSGCIGGVIAAVVVLILVVITVSVIFGGRNNMVTKEVSVDNAWAQVQNVYDRRLQLIPNLAESVKAYMKLEKDIFESIANARAGIKSAETPSQIESVSQKIEPQITSFIRDLNVIVEDTPELKASEVVKDLMTQLEGTENRIAVERMRYNESVKDYNTYIRLFPNNFVAGLFGFTLKEFFEAVPGAETAPEVDLNLDE